MTPVVPAGLEARKEGEAVGLAGTPHEFPASALVDAKSRVFQVAEIMASEALSLYFILPSGEKAMPMVYLDCLWFQELK